jgi:hypothetical protein
MINHAVLQWQAMGAGVSYNPVEAVALSFVNLFPLFGLQRLWFSQAYFDALNPWLKALGGVETVLSLPLLFFLGLGLRTRFRLR